MKPRYIAFYATMLGLLLSVVGPTPPAFGNRIVNAYSAEYSPPSFIGKDTTSKHMIAVSLHAAIDLDGRLDEKGWADAQFVSGFRQKDPVEGAPESGRTELAILYDDEALYIGARMYYPPGTRLQTYMSRRDNAGKSERIIISLDTYHDRRTAYSFGVTASGVRIDYYHPDDREFRRDYSFDPVWEAATSIDSTCWTAEFRIPFSQLRFNDRRRQVWGINVNRYIPNLYEDDYWVLVPKQETGWSSRFGSLTGIEGIRPSSRIELLPYVAGSITAPSRPDAANPFVSAFNYNTRVGMDFKMGFGPNLTLDAAINPDFGQVEADPAEVNLSAYETFFPEKRPFFIEGSRLLQGNGPGYFYSRRIGQAPRGPASGDYVDRPDNTTILGAAKLTGRTPAGLSTGFLAAVTSQEYARTYDVETDSFSNVRVMPYAGYAVARVEHEFGAEASKAGFIFTGMNRAFTANDPLADIMTRSAVSGGGDWIWRFNKSEYEFSGYAGFSYIEGEPEAIRRVQTSSAHYFQRPDAGYLRLDSSARSLSGYTGELQLRRSTGEHWLWRIGASLESPGFEINDVGRLRSADDIRFSGRLTYRETVPGEFYYQYAVNLSASQELDFGGVGTGRYTRLELNVTWKNFWRSRFSVGFSPRSLSKNLTRGGPYMGTGAGMWTSASLSNNFTEITRWQARGSYSFDELGSWSFNMGGMLGTSLNSSTEIAVYPGFSRSVNSRQYVMATGGGRETTYGKRYIFAFIDRTTISAQFRINYAITPDISVEMYAEPFAASGHYYDFGELEAARSRNLRRYGTDGTTIQTNDDGSYVVKEGDDEFTIPNRDFQSLSFRSNLVLRWEWIPGSTLYLVWQQNRSQFARTGNAVGFDSLLDTVSADGDNYIVLKISYWFPAG